MSETEKKELNAIVSDFMGHNIEIYTEEVGQDKVGLWITESFNGVLTSINSRHISDGLLRMIALIAIATQKETRFIIDIPITDTSIMTGIIMFDEIENGINPYLTEKYIGLFRKLIEVTGQQIIVTTHSPIVVDDINPEELIFLWKDDSGAVQGKKMFETEDMRDLLKALYPGEVWVNLDTNNILKRLNVEANTQVSA
jgi:predicted ATPase